MSLNHECNEDFLSFQTCLLLYVIVFSQVPSYSVSGLLGISSISFTSFLQGIAIHINKEGLFKTTKLGSRKETRCGSPIWYARDWQIHSSRPTICGLVCKFSCFNNIGGNNGSKLQRPWFWGFRSCLGPDKDQLLPTTRTSIWDAHVITPLGPSGSSFLLLSTDAVWLYFLSGSTFVSLATSSSSHLDWAWMGRLPIFGSCKNLVYSCPVQSKSKQAADSLSVEVSFDKRLCIVIAYSSGHVHRLALIPTKHWASWWLPSGGLYVERYMHRLGWNGQRSSLSYSSAHQRGRMSELCAVFVHRPSVTTTKLWLARSDLYSTRPSIPIQSMVFGWRECTTFSSSLPSCLLSHMLECTMFFVINLLATESGVLMMSCVWTTKLMSWSS